MGLVSKSHELVPIISRCPMIATEIQSKLSEGSTDDEKSGETETQSQVAILKKQNEIQLNLCKNSHSQKRQKFGFQDQLSLNVGQMGDS